MIFKFSSPPKSELVVFDGASMTDLKFVLQEKNYLVIENRRERIKIIYLGIFFLINCLKNFIFNLSKNTNLHTIYLYTLIKMINPRIVITSIDNSFKFSDLARLLSKKIKFIAIQNANRFDFQHNSFFFKKNHIKINLNRKYFIPHFLCFGQHEINECKKYNILVKNFYKIGSLRVSNFFEYIKSNKIKLNKTKFDVCLISESNEFIDERLKTNGLKKRFIQIAKLTIKYCIKHNLKFVFVQKRIFGTNLNKIEINFYKKNLNKIEFEYLIKNSIKKKTNSYSSYFGLFQSKVAVAGNSTLLREKLGSHEKILCMVPNKSVLNFPIDGVCKLNNFKYLNFEKRMNLIMNMSIKDYLKRLNKPTNFVMNFNKNLSTIKIVKQIFF